MKEYITIVFFSLLCLSARSQSIEIIKAKDALEIINNRDTASVIIDGRSDTMFAEKHIEGAINIDAFKDSLTVELQNHLANREIIVYCTNHRRADIIIDKLKELHYKGTIVFISDGINGWNSAEYKTVSTVSTEKQGL